MAPPFVDSYYSYQGRTMPVVLNTVHFGADTPSRVTLPFVPLTGMTLGEPLACGEYHQVRCFPDQGSGYFARMFSWLDKIFS